MTGSARKHRLEARISEDALFIIRRAAELQGRSVSDFVVQAAEAAARREVEETHKLRLTVEESIRFVEALMNPPPPNDALERAKEAHERLIGPL